MKKNMVVRVFCTFVLFVLVSCGQHEPAESSSQELSAESRQFTITVPAGTDFLQVALGGTETLRLYDRAVVEKPITGFGAVTNTGTIRSDFGVESQVGNIDSVAPTFLFDRSKVNGNVTSSGSITKSSGVVVTGSTRPNTPLTPSVTWTWQVQFPNTSQNVSIFPGQVQSLAPGSYASVFVYPGARISLVTGTYFIDQFDLENQGTLALDTSGGPIFLYSRTSFVFRGLTTGGSAETLLVGYAGALPVTIASNFNGTLVAPNAPVHFGPAGSSHSGAAFAKAVSLDANARFTFRRFAGWDFLFPPKPFVVCVSQVGTNRFSALLGYDNPLNTVVQIPRGSANDLFGVLTNAAAAPVTTFQVGRVEHALWAPFTSQLTWTVRGNSAIAKSTSPGCGSGAYPAGIPTPALAGKRPEGPSLHVGALPKPPPFGIPTRLSDSQIVTALNTTALPLALSKFGPVGASAARPELTGATFPFVFHITKGFVGEDGVFELPELFATVTIDGVNAGGRSLGPCDGTPSIGEGCVYSSQFDLDETFSVPVSASKATVTVSIDLDDIDIGPNDDVHNIDLTVNNLDGSWTGTVNSPTNCSTNNGWGICWTIEPAGPPVVTGTVAICGSWNALYVDEGFGESRLGTAIPGQTFKAYTASHTAVSVFIRSGFVPDDTMTHVINGNYGANGCIDVPATFFVHNPAATSFPGGDLAFAVRQVTSMTTPTGITYNITDKANGNAMESVVFATANAGLPTPPDATIDTSGWATVRGWKVPPARIDLVGSKHTSMSTTAAAITSILTAADNGIVPATYSVVVNDGCLLKGQIDSCASDSTLMVGPAHTPSPVQSCINSSTCPSIQECMLAEEGCNGRTGCICRWPHQARWKYVVAHEAGHAIQNVAAGSWLQTEYAFPCTGPNCPGIKSDFFPGQLVDPPWSSELCGCQHVDAANGEHCLQSIERSGAAQGEGVAQFYASKVWNRPETPECTFVYYKEFLDTTCHSADCVNYTALNGTVFKSTLPPAPVSCRTPARWRNKQGCNIIANPGGRAGDYGTEYDWMGFLYNQNAPADPAAPRTLMSQLWGIYRHACNPPPVGQPPSATPPICNDQKMVWDAQNTSETSPRGFLQGIQDQFPSNVDRQRIVAIANTYGVSADTSP